MGCVSSNLLNRDDEFTQLGSSALGHHIVSLTSTTYGLLTLDPPSHSTTIPLSPQPSFTTSSEPRSLCSEPTPVPARPDIINSWELMSGLDADSFRFSPILNPNTIKNVTVSKRPVSRSSPLDKFQADSFRFPNTLLPEKENTDPNLNKNDTVSPSSVSKRSPLDKLENLCCPPNGENRVVIYTTSLRGIRKTFEDCNAVRSAIESYGVVICERDISMDRGFKEELRELMKGTNQTTTTTTTPPRVFIKGRYVGGVEEVMRMVDQGCFGDLIKGLPEKKIGNVCDGCGDVKFLPCFRCNGSCKMAVEEKGRKTVVVRCMDCNENGLVLCPVCS